MTDLWMNVDAALSEVPVNIMPLLDDTDFKTRETAVAYNAAGMDLVWNFVTTAGAFTQTAVTPTSGGNYDWTHQGDAMYTIEIPASGGASINNDTEGFGWFTGYADGVLPWRGPIIGFRAAQLNDALIDGGDLLQVDVTQIDGQATNGNNATLNLKQLNIVNNAGSAIIASSTGSNGHGINASGNGTGMGLQATGGATGCGVNAVGGATSGYGLVAQAQAGSSSGVAFVANTGGYSLEASGGMIINATGTNQAGLTIVGNGAGNAMLLTAGATGDGIQVTAVGGDGIQIAGGGANHGIRIVPGATGNGINIIGGATSGAAVRISGTAGNAQGLHVTGQGNGDGIEISGGASGDGISAIGGALSGVGVRIESLSSASAMLVSSASGYSIDATGGVLIAANSGQEGIYIGGATDGIRIDAGTNSPSVRLVGNGTGHGLQIMPGATGNGINVIGGATSGAAVRIAGTAGNAQGLHVTGQGSAAAIHATGGATGHGVLTQGGATSGNGIYALAQTSGHGARFDGLGSGAGILATGDSLDGIRATSTNANGIFAQGGTNQSGIRAAGNGTGAGVYAVGGASGDGMLLSGAGSYDLNALTIRALEAARTEPASVPVANAGALTKLDWIFTLTRNKRLTTATLDTLRNDADSGNIATAVLSDDGTTFTRNEYT